MEKYYKKQAIFILLFVIIFSSLSIVGAEEITLNISLNQEIFNPSDTFKVILILENNAQVKLDNLNLISNFGGVCEGFDSFQEFISLDLNEKKTIPLYSFVVPSVWNGDCEVSVSIIGQEGIIYTSYESFEIEGVLPDFSFQPLFCKNPSCIERSKIFLQGEDISIDYESDVSGLNVDATLIYPGGSDKNLNLPTTIKAEQIGTYDLEVSASKKDYKTVSLKEQFGVIESDADFSGNAILGNFDEGEENYGETKSIIDWKIWVAGIVIFFILILVVLFFILRKKENQDSSNLVTE